MNEWMNEWMKYLMDLLYNLILVEISFWKEQENHNNIYHLYQVYAYDNSRYYNFYEWIRLGLYNNSLIFCDTYMSVPRWSRPTINEAQVTQFNHLNYEITPSNLFSVPSTIDCLIIDHRDMDGHPQ